MRKPKALTLGQLRQARIEFARSGGKARQAGMTPEQRTALGKRAVEAREAVRKTKSEGGT